jgi:hypothetical protein
VVEVNGKLELFEFATDDGKEMKGECGRGVDLSKMQLSAMKSFEQQLLSLLMITCFIPNECHGDHSQSIPSHETRVRVASC